MAHEDELDRLRARDYAAIYNYGHGWKTAYVVNVNGLAVVCCKLKRLYITNTIRLHGRYFAI